MKYYHERSFDSTGRDVPAIQETPGPKLAFVACTESLSKLRELALISRIPADQAVFLSTFNRPEIRTPEELLRALPESVVWLLIQDVEYILPVNGRTAGAAIEFSLRLKQCAYPRELTVYATHSLKAAPPLLRIGVQALNPGGGDE